MNFTVRQIGIVKVEKEDYSLQLEKEYVPGLKHLQGFSHLQVLWWAHLTDEPEIRKRVFAENLFVNAPGEVGVFASRTPERPNPVMISVIKAERIDSKNGIIITPFIDAENGTPVIDIKPYFPVQRIRYCSTPECYSHWPEWAEDAGRFNWKKEIIFGKI